MKTLPNSIDINGIDLLISFDKRFTGSFKAAGLQLNEITTKFKVCTTCQSYCLKL